MSFIDKFPTGKKMYEIRNYVFGIKYNSRTQLNVPVYYLIWLFSIILNNND